MHDDLAQGLARIRELAATEDPLARADAIRLGESLIVASAGDPAAAVAAARIRVERAVALSALDHDTEALAELNQVVDAFGNAPVGAAALAARIRTHRWLGDDDAALADLALLVDQFGPSRDPEAREALCAGRDFRLAWLINESLRDDEDSSGWERVVHACDAIIVNHADDPGVNAERAVARALLRKANALRSLARHTDEDDLESTETLAQARSVADTLFARYAASTDAQIRGFVADSEGQADAATADPHETLVLTERALALAAAWDGVPEEFFARAAHHRGWALEQLDRDDEALRTLESMMSAHRGSASAAVRAIVTAAWAQSAMLVSFTHRRQDALATIDGLHAWAIADAELMERADARASLRQALTTRIRLWRGRLEDPVTSDTGVGGVAVHDSPATASRPLTPAAAGYVSAVGDLVTLYAADPHDGHRAGAATELFELGHEMRMRGHLDAAETAYRRLLTAFADETSPGILEQSVAPGMLNLGFLLLTLTDRPADSIEVYDAFLARFGDSTSAALRDTTAKVHASRSAALTLLYDRGLTPAGIDVDTLGAQERERIRTTLKRANALTDDRQYAQAIATYDEVINAHPVPRGPDLRMRVCDAMVRKGYCLGQVEDWHGSLRHHDLFLAEFGADVSTTIEKDLALGMGNRAFALDHLDRPEEVVDAYAQILRRWASSSVPYLIHQCARAAWKKGYHEEQLGRTQDAHDSYIRGARYLHAERADTQVEGAKAAVNLSTFLRTRNQAAEAAAVARRVIEALGDTDDGAARNQIVKAQLALARACQAAGDTDGARIAYEWCLGEGSKLLTDQQRKAANEEYFALVGGPFKGAWARLRRSFGSS